MSVAQAGITTAPFPLSYGQQAMWYTHHLASDGVPYNTAFVARICSPVDIGAFHQAWQILVDRHGALRTTFALEDGQLLQLVHESQAVDFEHMDAAAWRDAEVDDRVQAAYRQPFDLEQGPPCRIRLFSRGDSDHILLFVAHHIVTDARSQWCLLNELRLLYPALRSGETPDMPELGCAYSDYVTWQATVVEAKGERLWDFWRKQLDGELPVLNLPTDRPRPPVQTFNGASELMRVPGELAERLRSLASECETTIYQLLLAAYQVLLHRYSGQDDIAVGSPVSSGRIRREFTATVGYFNDMLVTRCDLSGNPPFRTFLKQVSKSVWQGLLHQQLPFSVLVERLQLKRDPSYSPVFQAALVIDQPPRELVPILLGEADRRVDWGGLELAPFQMGQQEGLFDLLMMIVDGGMGESLLAYLTYNKDLFDSNTTQRMLRHFVNLLASIVAEPECRIDSLRLLDEAERDIQLIKWNATGAAYPADKCLHEVFESQAVRTPTAVAVVHGPRSLNYEELNARSNQLARHLQEQGVGLESVVGVCLDRSPETLISFLAILKAGGAYLPLEPSQPLERSRFQLDQAAVQVVITTTACSANLPAETVRLIDLDTASESIARHDTSNLPPLATPQHLAYIIYTSGSTGLPKGAMVIHRGMMNHLYAKVHDLELTAKDRVAQTAPQSFDISVWQLFAGLLVGGSVEIVDSETVREPSELIGLVDRQQISILEVVPSLFRALLDELADRGQERPEFADLRWLLLTGEALPPVLCHDWFALYTSIPLMNAYGPTECSDDVTHHVLRGDLPAESTNVPIGRPVANTQLYILDGQMQPSPIGVPGELYVGGDGVGRGYVGDAKRTAAAFVPSPFAAAGSASCLYRTGDLTRYLADGTIEFLGRLDHQVKVRGFRIELGEIETALNASGQVSEAVVLLREDEPGLPRLVAYVVPEVAVIPERNGDSSFVDKLRGQLRRRLPDYMVPTAFVFLDSLPLTANGKLNRDALPAPETPDLDAQYVAPRNAVEQQMCEIWQDTLGVERVGVEDNFFELGGDSIVGIKVVSRAREHNIRLTAQQLFQHQTIAELPLTAAEEPRIQAEPELVSGDVALTPIQRLFFESELGDLNHFNQSVLLTVQQPLTTGTLETIVARLLDHHDALRLRCERDVAGNWRQYHADTEDHQVVRRVELSNVDAEQLEAVIEAAAAETNAMLDLGKGPLLRVVLFDFGDARPAQVLFVIHHLAVDGISWRILLDDIERLYAQLNARQPLSLPHKTTSFQQWSEQLGVYASSDELLAELPYWRTIVEQPVSAFPVDHANGENRARDEETVTETFTAEESEALLRRVPQAYQTQINDVLLTAVLQAYGAWSGERELRLGLEGHGREELFPQVDLSRTVGWFTTVFPVFLQSPQADSVEASLKAVKEQLRAVPQRGVGFGVLAALADDPRTDVLRQAAGPPLCFNYLGKFEAAAASGALLEGLTETSLRLCRSPHSNRRCLIEVVGMVSGGQLRVDWTFSRELHDRSHIEAFAAAFRRALLELIAHCTDPQTGGYTPSDFPLCGLTQHQLDRIVPREQSRQKLIEDILPLSPMQQGMLYHTLREPDAGHYLAQIVIRMEGPLDVAAFRHAWEQLQRRHTVLRSTLAWQHVPHMLQLVHRQQELDWTLSDWRGLPREQQQRGLESARTDSIDFERGPLWSVELVWLDERDWACVLSVPHVLGDGWSFPLMLSEVMRTYTAAIQRQEVSLPKARPYRDYIHWIGQQDREAAKSFWQEQLAGVTAATPLVVDRLNREAASGCEEIDWKLSAETYDRLKQFGRRNRVTVNTLVQGAWALLLNRYSGEDEVLFGVTSSGRPPELAGVDEMIGIFINTLPALVRVSQDERLVDWLQKLQDQQVTQRQFEHCSLVDIQSWSGVARGTPMFESLVVFENIPMDADALTPPASELKVAKVDAKTQTSYPLTLAVIPGEDLSFQVQYDRTRFDRETIERVASHLATLLEGFESRPECRIGDLPMLTGEEQQKLLRRGNPTSAEPSPDKCVQQLFEEQVERTPDAVAVAFEGRQLTYSELNARSNQLAHHLRELGVGPEVVVAICLERSLEMLVGVLGILKAGGAYVPLDPEYPSGRLAFMLHDSRALVLLTQQSLRQQLPEHPRVVDLDADQPRIARQSVLNLETETTPANLAYVIYTSGSTGTPKGVLIEHGSMLAHCLDSMRSYALTADDCVLQFASLSFDLSVEQIWPTLLAGGRLLLRGSNVWSAAELLENVETHQLTVCDLPTAYWQQLLGELEKYALRDPGLKSLRLMIIGGEAVALESVERWQQLPFEYIRMINAYGPTETTVTATSYELPREPIPYVRVPIGHPLGNRRVYILDSLGRLAPIGVPGELHIGGGCLARGYLDRPELTAEKFIRNPFADDPDSRLYKTGDLCCWLPDGNLEFLGRIDYQVKIRGYRIELSEIEAALLAHPQIQHAVAIAREDEPGEKRLVGYVVPFAGDDGHPLAPSVSELREHLSKRLPGYMVPSAFVILNSLPLTPNGKVDRNSLPAADGGCRPERHYSPPRTPVEERLCDVWQQVLRVDRVGVTDNFFELGGDSILSIQVISRASELGIRVTARHLFEHQSIISTGAGPGSTA